MIFGNDRRHARKHLLQLSEISLDLVRHFSAGDTSDAERLSDDAEVRIHSDGGAGNARCARPPRCAESSISLRISLRWMEGPNRKRLKKMVGVAGCSLSLPLKAEVWPLCRGLL